MTSNELYTIIDRFSSVNERLDEIISTVDLLVQVSKPFEEKIINSPGIGLTDEELVLVNIPYALRGISNNCSEMRESYFNILYDLRKLRADTLKKG